MVEMTAYAYIQNGVVTDIVQVSPASIFTPEYAAHFIEAPDEVQWGWLFDGEAFSPPSEPEPAVVYKDFTSLEYLDMFTEAEQLAVVSATMTVPEVKLWYDRMLAASFVTYADLRTEAGLQALVTAGLITEARKAEIVSELTTT